MHKQMRCHLCCWPATRYDRRNRTIRSGKYPDKCAQHTNANRIDECGKPKGGRREITDTISEIVHSRESRNPLAPPSPLAEGDHKAAGIPPYQRKPGCATTQFVDALSPVLRCQSASLAFRSDSISMFSFKTIINSDLNIFLVLK